MARLVETGVRVKAEDRASPVLNRLAAKSKTAFGSIKGAVKSTATSFAELQSAISLAGRGVSIVQKFIELAAEQERVERRLAAGLRVRGQFTREGFEAIRQFNNAIQQSLGIGDETLFQLQGTLVALGVRNDKLAEATRFTIGLSEVTGDLNSAARLVGRALQGDTTLLTRYIGKVFDADEAQAKLNDLFKIASERSGTLAAESKRLAGNLFDLGEKIGQLVGPKSLTKLADIILGVNKAIDDPAIGKTIERYTDFLNVVVGLLPALRVQQLLQLGVNKTLDAAGDSGKKQREELKKQQEEVKKTTDVIVASEIDIAAENKKRIKAVRKAQEEFVKNLNLRAQGFRQLREVILGEEQRLADVRFEASLQAQDAELAARVRVEAIKTKLQDDAEKRQERTRMRRMRADADEARARIAEIQNAGAIAAGVAGTLGMVFGQVVQGTAEAEDVVKSLTLTALGAAEQVVVAEAAKGAAAAFAAHAGIPFVGGAIGAAAAATVFAAIKGFVGSFQEGGRVPATGMAFVHEGEEIIPRSRVPAARAAGLTTDTVGVSTPAQGMMITINNNLLATPSRTQMDRTNRDVINVSNRRLARLGFATG